MSTNFEITRLFQGMPVSFYYVSAKCLLVKWFYTEKYGTTIALFFGDKTFHELAILATT